MHQVWRQGCNQKSSEGLTIQFPSLGGHCRTVAAIFYAGDGSALEKANLHLQRRHDRFLHRVIKRGNGAFKKPKQTG